MPTLTAAQLDKRILARIDNNTQLYTFLERMAALTEGARVLNLFTAFKQKSVALDRPTQANRIWYDLPYDLVIPTKVQADGRYLKRGRLLQIGRARTTWVTETTLNQLQPMSEWIPVGLRKFAIWPADSCGGQQITVTGIAEIPPFVSPDDTISLSNDSLAALDLLATHVLLLKESSKIFGQGSKDWLKFQKIVKEMTAYNGFRQPVYYVNDLPQPTDR